MMEGCGCLQSAGHGLPVGVTHCSSRAGAESSGACCVCRCPFALWLQQPGTHGPGAEESLETERETCCFRPLGCICSDMVTAPSVPPLSPALSSVDVTAINDVHSGG